ncbi:leucine-rich repeat receptor-like protein kinase PXC2 [Durio zibethinus]|uniref:Leucine-rich repeat receptor-like protein kinase PXC2 n=1 Tax=Durio zibethinus TaxID=66656 RepID=A0A6P5Z0J6_DURZI|nr:leucine-rich repeat receptor-like protein kinase PXC2 [Durio zibethinus]
MTAVTISFFGFLLVIAATVISFCDGNSNMLCIESERQVLLKFKQHLMDRSNRLSSWVEGEDCCEWVGVFCNNFTGHVNELHLGLSRPYEGASDAEWDAYLRSKLGGKINPSLIELKHLSFLDLSNNDFGGLAIPEFIGSMNTKTLQWVSGLSSLQYLDLSDANLTKATDWLQATHKLPSLVELHLSGCRLNNDPSPISVIPNVNQLEIIEPKCLESLCNLREMDLSNNGIDQEVSEIIDRSLSNSLCNSSTKLETLTILDIESNLLSGEIPDCWENWQMLQVLNLGNNNLTGKIPRSLGSLRYIKSLNLRTNKLFGEVPSTLQHLDNMLILDLSENQLTGSIPAWIGDKLFNPVVLNLRSNKFQAIPDQICALNSLQFLDLGYNNISGAIPKCFSNLSAMATKTLNGFLFEVPWEFNPNNWVNLDALLVMRGREDEYSTTLGLVTGVDLSVNSLTGEIPKELGNLTELRSLNLSGNLLTGQIPENIGNMEVLESLDLSMNRLHGEIPSSFSNLNFLNHFNVSYNNLTGKIPLGTQLQSFDKFSYIGNHLCGPPITKNCSRNGETPDITNGDSSEGRHRSKVNWLYVSIVVGFVMGFWGVVAPLFFIRSWRFAYYKKLEHIGDKLYVFWATIGM